MTRTLAGYNAGATEKMTCYQKGCEGVSITVVLGRLLKINQMIDVVGRIVLIPGGLVKLFELEENCECPQCHTHPTHVIVASIGGGQKPLVFGCDLETIQKWVQ
jgi:hypothetical protein